MLSVLLAVKSDEDMFSDLVRMVSKRLYLSSPTALDILHGICYSSVSSGEAVGCLSKLDFAGTLASGIIILPLLTALRATPPYFPSALLPLPHIPWVFCIIAADLKLNFRRSMG